MWQSWVKIEHYSIAYFVCFTGGAHTRYVDLSGIHASLLHMSHALNGSFVLQFFEHDKKLRNR